MENSSRPNWFKITDNFRDYVVEAVWGGARTVRRALRRATGPAHGHRARPKPTARFSNGNKTIRPHGDSALDLTKADYYSDRTIRKGWVGRSY